MQLSPLQLENQVNTFNEAYPVGSTVEVLKSSRSDETFIDTVKRPATIMGGHTAMMWLKEKGSYDLTFVKGLATTNKEDSFCFTTMKEIKKQ